MILHGDALTMLKTLSDESVHCCVTSPPYWKLRDYGTAKWEGGNAGCDHKGTPLCSSSSSLAGYTSENIKLRTFSIPMKAVCSKCGAVRVDDQLGLEKSPEEYVAKMVEVFREVKRVLRDDGTLWLNLGDSYAGGGPHHGERTKGKSKTNRGCEGAKDKVNLPGLKPKDLCGIPWRVAFALQADGWWLRQDIIWCLSGGTLVYAKTQKGEMPMTVKDMARLDPTTVKLWNGERWTQVLGWSKSQRKGDELEIVLRSGERISCTPTHKFPTERGLLEAKDIKVGDCLHRVRLPEPQEPKDCNIDEQAAWLAGLYIAEGSRSGDCIQIAGHAKEEERWRRVQMIAARYGGSATRTINGNMMNIRVYGKIINAIIDYLVTGKTAKDKGFSQVVWQYSNSFISEMLDGYLKGDGHWDDTNQRWRLGFTRNYNLERDLRTACARLGYKITLNMSTTPYNGKHAATFRGEIRYEASTYHNRRNDAEVMEIRKSRCREVYDIGVEDEPHVFALASGLLTHNSKPNPMPESVTDRCTKSHEYIFLMAKSQRYYYDAEAIQEKGVMQSSGTDQRDTSITHGLGGGNSGINEAKRRMKLELKSNGYVMRNKRTVWTITTKPFREAHFATFPPDLIEPCILAGCPEGGIVLDPFFGSGTTGLVCSRLNRQYIGIELNEQYVEMSKRRIEGDAPLLNVKEVQK